MVSECLLIPLFTALQVRAPTSQNLLTARHAPTRLRAPPGLKSRLRSAASPPCVCRNGLAGSGSPPSEPPWKSS
eukprot:235490-Prorocentrum_minimum.AAC.1